VRKHFPGYWTVVPIIGVALVPLFAVRFLPRFWPAAAAIGIALVPLFVTGTDYGRWVFLGIASLSILAMATWREVNLETFDVPLYAAALYCMSWGFAWYAVASLWAPGLFDRLML
jgi:hypothetical protein